MNIMKIPAGLGATAVLSAALGTGLLLLGGCEYICSSCEDSTSTTSAESEPVKEPTETSRFESDYQIDMGIDPVLDGDADMMLVQIAAIDSSQSSR